jgi:hemolysin III
MSTIADAAPRTGRRQSKGEEIANAVSHAAGAIAALVAFPFLIGAALRSGLPVWPFAIFGLTLVVLFSASAVYHAASDPEIKRRLRVIDHASIYLLIAGTYSAYSIAVLGGVKGWILFTSEWVIAAFGLWLSARRIDRFRAASALIYVAMGWLIAPVLGDMRAALAGEAFFLLAAGGVAYTLGVVFYAIKRVPYFHAIWHLFVLAGAACHVASLILARGY